MRKFILSLLSVFFTCCLAQAQTPYGVYQIPFTPETFDPVNTVSLYDDTYSGIIDIGFPFEFFGQSYDSLVISSNGYVRFQLEYAGNFSDFSVNQSLPDPTAPLDAIFLSWFDLDPSSQPIISYATIGTAPERVFIVNYNNVPYFGCAQTQYTGQLKLYEGSNNIEMHITSRPFCDNAGGWVNLAIQGIQTQLSEVTSDGNTLWRVRVGPYNSVEESNSVRDKLSGMGIKPTLIKSSKS